MRAVYRPFRIKKLNKRLTLLLKEALENAPVAPVKELQKEAAEFEEMMLFRRMNVKKKSIGKTYNIDDVGDVRRCEER